MFASLAGDEICTIRSLLATVANTPTLSEITARLATRSCRSSSRRRASPSSDQITTEINAPGWTGDEIVQENPEQLVAVGPTSEEHHFPLWYKDAAGTRLELAIDPTDPRTPAMGELPFPGSPVSFPDNFPDESFYMLAEATLPTGGTATPGRARLVLALEAAFATEAVVNGQQMVFGRVRVRIDGAIPGASYVFTHPYGQTDPLPADDRGRVFVTQAVGTLPLAFDVALTSEVAPFLRWTFGDELGPGEFDPPPGYVGDGSTAHTISGSPLGFNFFRIDGPDVASAGGPRDPADPTNPDRIQTPLFTLQGRFATVAGVDVPRAVYSRGTDGTTVIDVFATSEDDQLIRVDGTGVSATQLQGGRGRYFARASASAPPAQVRVVNASDTPPSGKTSPVTDAVIVTRADYDVQARTLTVAAASSDEMASPDLTVAGFGPLTGGQTTFTLVDAPPTSITVTSSANGAESRTTAATGAPLAPLPVTADAGADLTVQQGQTVTLDGSASTGAATSFAWTQGGGPDVVLVDPAARITTFTAPSTAADLDFTLTVDGSGGPSTDSVVVHVAPLTAPIADAGPDTTGAVGSTVTLNGTGSAGTVAFAWAQVSGPPVVLVGAGTPRPSFVMPAGATPVVVELTATGPGGPPSADTVTVTALPDVVVVETAQFRTSKLEWRVEGTASGQLPDTVEVHLDGQIVGAVQVDAAHAWDLRRTLSTSEQKLRPTAGDVVTVTTSRGGSRTQPVNVRN